MLTTIVFFFALFSTLVVINTYRDRATDNIQRAANLTIRIAFCLLWSWLYYLSH